MRNLNPRQFLKNMAAPPAKVNNWDPNEHPFSENPNTFKGPSWAMHASNAINRYEGAKAFSAPGGGIRAVKYVLGGSPGQARGVRATEIGEALGRSGGGEGREPFIPDAGGD